MTPGISLSLWRKGALVINGFLRAFKRSGGELVDTTNSIPRCVMDHLCLRHTLIV